MLFLLTGDDRDRITKAIRSKIGSAESDGTYRRHVGDVTVVMLDPYFTESLFGETYAVLLDGLSLFPEDTRQFLLGQMERMRLSENIFVLVDEKFPKEFKDAAKSGHVPIEEYAKKEETRDGPNVFAFTDAYLSRDKRKAWLQFMDLVRGGSPAEEIHGALFWAVKSLWLVKAAFHGGNADDLNMKPFVYQKTKRLSVDWKEEEAKGAFQELSDMLERTRKTGGDLSIALERHILR